jgi:hypothetical protein
MRREMSCGPRMLGDVLSYLDGNYKRAIVLGGVMTEMFLVRRDRVGPHTLFWGRVRHDWPIDVLGQVGDLRVASVAAMSGYRGAHDRIRAERADLG